MRVVETIFAIIVAVVGGVLLPMLYHGANMDKTKESNVSVATEQFLKKTIAYGFIALKDCDLLIDGLVDSGYDGNVTVSVSRYEYDVANTFHRYDTSWEEIETVLIEEGRYDLQPGSYVQVRVKGRRTSPLSELSSIVKTEYFAGE